MPVFSLKRQKHSKEKERVVSFTQNIFIVQEQSEWDIHDLCISFPLERSSCTLKISAINVAGRKRRV
jgi:hypothetical protein